MSNPIRILRVTAGMNRGGLETITMNQYRNIDRTKVQFDFILHTTEECVYNNEIRNLGGKIYSVPRYKGKNHFKYIKAWNTFFKEHPEYKIIHGHVRSTASIYLKIANKYGLTTIAHSHSTASRGNKIEQIVKNIIQLPVRYIAKYLFACSVEAGRWLFGTKAFKKDNFKVINNAIETEKYVYNKVKRNEKRKYFNIDDKFVIGHIGTFTYPKNHIFLIDIFKEIHDKNEDAVLLLIGDGELRSSIEQKIKALNLSENVILTGVRHDIPDLLQAFDVFLFPSIFEGLPVSLIEAQASGVLCIVSDTITKEVEITNSVVFLSIKDSANYWSDVILKEFNDFNRVDNYKTIKGNGYDIKTEVSWLQEFYLKVTSKDKITINQ